MYIHLNEIRQFLKQESLFIPAHFNIKNRIHESFLFIQIYTRSKNRTKQLTSREKHIWSDKFYSDNVKFKK